MGSTATNTYGDLSPRTAAFASAKLLKRGQHLMVTERFGQTDPLQKNKSDTVKWRRYNSLPRASAPLAEGIPPAGSKLTYTDVQCTMEQYGDFTEITDRVADFHEDPVLAQAMEVLGEQAAETIEAVRIGFMKAGTNVFYTGAATSRATVNAPIDRATLRKIYRFLKKYKAKEITEIVSASAKISTEPVAAAYFALGHTDLLADLQAISGWTPVEQYSDHMKAVPGEVGKVEQFRFVLTPMFEPWNQAGASGTTYLSGGVAVSVAANCDVYPLLFIAKDSYGIVPFQGKRAVKVAVVNPGNPTKDDPMGQKGFASWIAYQTGAILNQSWLVRCEVGATANPS